jgi:hypothetical protein
MKEVVAKEVAEKEVTAWMDYKKVKPSQRETRKADISVLVEAVQYGLITIDPSNDFQIKQTLEHPIAELATSELVYKSRANYFELQKSTAITKDSFTGTMMALTGKPLSTIQRLDSEDCKIGYAIALFF